MMYENSGLINWVIFKGVEDFLGKADPKKIADPVLHGLVKEYYDLRKRVANSLMAPQVPIDFDKDAK